jgi:hypothetical protein
MTDKLTEEKSNYGSLVEAISKAHERTQQQATQAVNIALTLRNWLVGYYIFEYEQNGSDRANYGEKLLENLSKDLKKRLGKGFTKRTLEMFRQFYTSYPIAKSVISQFGVNLPATLSVEMKRFEWQDEDYFNQLFKKLSWTHFIELMRIEDDLKRAFYEVQTLQNKWSVRELKRQTDTRSEV